MLKGFVRKDELRRARLWAVLCVLTLGLVALQISLEGVCWDKGTSEKMELAKAAGCFEFWFNRYQTLIGTVAAVGAAAAAWFAAQGQISAARHQAEIGRQQYAAAALPVLQDLLSRLKNADAAIEQLMLRLESVRLKILRSHSTLLTAFEEDGNQIGSRFSAVIFRLERYNDGFDESIKEFNSMHIEAREVGSKANANHEVFREHLNNCHEMDRRKLAFMHAYVGYEMLFDACKRGDIETAQILWQDLRDEDDSFEPANAERPQLKEAHLRTALKIETIVSALVS